MSREAAAQSHCQTLCCVAVKRTEKIRLLGVEGHVPQCPTAALAGDANASYLLTQSLTFETIIMCDQRPRRQVPEA